MGLSREIFGLHSMGNEAQQIRLPSEQTFEASEIRPIVLWRIYLHRDYHDNALRIRRLTDLIGDLPVMHLHCHLILTGAEA